MWSSFRKQTQWAAVAVAALGISPRIFAQQTLFMPGIEVSGQWDSNRQLVTTGEDSTSGGRATLDARIRRITPRSDTEFHPQISYQKYSGQSDVDSVEGNMDLRSKYETQKGQFGLLGRYRRQDEFNAVVRQAAFDGDDPSLPDDVTSTTVTGGITRTSYLLQPSFSYSVTQRTDLEGTLRYQAVDFNSELPGVRVGYQSPSVEMEIVRELTQRLRLGFGPYYSHFERDDNSSESDTVGASLSLRFRGSERTRSILRLTGERDEETRLEPIRAKDTGNAWGVQWTGIRENRVGSVEYRIGRFLEPTEFGGRRKVDTLRVEYNRPLSHKTLLRGGIRYIKAKSISDLDAIEGQNQASGDLMLRHFFNESFFVSGTYRYAWIDRDSLGNANNHGFLLTLGLREKDPTGGWRQ